MNAIKHLQERTSKTSIKADSTQTAEISLKPVIIERDSPKLPSPKPPSSKPPSPKLSSSKPPSPKLPKDFIESDTVVYAVWFDDDGLAYEVC
jgi:hypothetical protein